MDLLLIGSAFIAGLLATAVKLPPMVGFLIAGFVLNYAGYQSQESIALLADLGVTLLLFTIGLKLDVKSLLNKEIWLGSTLHNLLSTLVFIAGFTLLKYLGVGVLAEMGIEQMALLAFALSFSSTVFAIKTLHDKGEMNANYATLAIGILVMQDIFAVIFLTASTGKLPYWYAIVLLLLPLLRPVFYRIMDFVGHGEMLVLFGITAALVTGAGLFQLVGMKPDLGALVLGILLAGHNKSSELSKSLFNMKELFLICFFLNIGLSANLTWSGAALALVIMLLLPLKGLLYYWVINQFKFRARTSMMASLTLFNYSEFGLIVAGLAFQMGWMANDILVALALAVSLSFIIAAPLNRFGHAIYHHLSPHINDVDVNEINPKDQRISAGHAQVLILGMGRIGRGAYDELTERFGSICLGVEVREDTACRHREAGRNVIVGDATDSDFWERILDTANIKLVLLAMPHHQGNQFALEQLNNRHYTGKTAAIAEYHDQMDSLVELGVDAAFNIYSEAGLGFARHVCEKLESELKLKAIK